MAVRQAANSDSEYDLAVLEGTQEAEKTAVGTSSPSALA